MGALTSRQNPGVEEAEVVSNHAYKYPPRSGNYFGSHFIMGGERFDTPQPEAYLFGENADLNFLGSRPTSFPYPPPQSNEPTKTLKSLINIRKESLRFVRCMEPEGKLVENDKLDEGKDVEGKGMYYNIEFTFDCDVRCAITIFYFCTEEVTPNSVVYYPRDASMTSQTYHYKKGANQQFCQSTHVIDPTQYSEEDLTYSSDREIIPIAIYCVVDEGQDEIRQSHTTIAVVEKHSDGTYVLKALKQKLFVDGLCYLLQEIYGIENKNLDTKPTSDEETEDGGSECVICMCDVRDTLILPCRHLCLCNNCADSLRYQANNCPICRAPFRALLQIRALQKISGPPPLLPTSPADDMENIPPGYEPVSLLEALNGPHATRVNANTNNTAATIASPDTDTQEQAAEALNRCNLERTSSTSLVSGGTKKHKSSSDKTSHNTPSEFRMSVLLAREDEKTATEKTNANSPLLYNHKQIKVTAADKNPKTISDYQPEHNNIEANGTEISTGSGEQEVLEAETDGAQDPDSDAERLSPLLTTHIPNGSIKCGRVSPVAVTGALTLDAAVGLAHIDDTDTDEPDLSSASPIVCERCRGGIETEDSDYFTPEDTNTTILTIPKTANKHDILSSRSVECTPQRWALPHHVTSLPGTPLSHSSVKSSGESYSSTSSTRQLLTASALAAPNLAADTAC